MSVNKRRRITPQEEEDLNEVEETFEPFVSNLQSQIDDPNISMDIDYDDDVMPELTLEDLQVEIDPDEGITDGEFSDDDMMAEFPLGVNQVEIDPDEGITDGEFSDDDTIGGRRKKRTRRRNSKIQKKSGKRKTKTKKRKNKKKTKKRKIRRKYKTKKLKYKK